ncbi:MAG: hypothetical protein IJB19_06175 [Clostridia bacterium]|nr:hypothetical protein [Clostridia bacterium]
MSEKYIYSKRYVAERIDMGIKYPAITIQRKRNKNFNKDEFVKLAVALSETNRIGLDLLEREDRLRADFILHTEIILEKNAYLWGLLFDASDRFVITVRSSSPQTVVVRFVHMKTEYENEGQ